MGFPEMGYTLDQVKKRQEAYCAAAQPVLDKILELKKNEEYPQMVFNPDTGLTEPVESMKVKLLYFHLEQIASFYRIPEQGWLEKVHACTGKNGEF